MEIRRLLQSVRLAFARGGYARANYLRKNQLLAHVGERVTYQPRRLPLYGELIRLHDNVAIARNVDFCTHDIMYGVFNRYAKSRPELGNVVLKERVGCIEVGENTFIGSNVVVLYGSRIGRNVIVGTGSLVTGDLESDSVYVGVPAKRVGSYQDLLEKYHDEQSRGVMATVGRAQRLTVDEIHHAWELFDKESDAP